MIMSEENAEQQIVKKLDKVADSLETTTSQLSSVVTQQQLDLIRERISKNETDLAGVRESVTSLSEKLVESSQKKSYKLEDVTRSLTELERDYAAIRSLMFSSFALSTISVIGLVICSIYL